MNRAAICLAASVLFLAGGCGSYHKVTDPTTGKVYYTDNYKARSSGAATLRDGATGNTVNLQNSEATKISKDEYDRGRYQRDDSNSAKTAS